MSCHPHYHPHPSFHPRLTGVNGLGDCFLGLAMRDSGTSWGGGVCYILVRTPLYVIIPYTPIPQPRRLERTWMPDPGGGMSVALQSLEGVYTVVSLNWVSKWYNLTQVSASKFIAPPPPYERVCPFRQPVVRAHWWPQQQDLHQIWQFPFYGRRASFLPYQRDQPGKSGVHQKILHNREPGFTECS